MPVIPPTTAIAEYAGGVGAGAFALLFLLQKFFNSWKSDTTENSVITMMHTEIERMSEQNSRLSLELGKLQQELIELNKELRALTAENQRLHGEVMLLTGEVARLQTTLEKTTQEPT